MSRVNIQGVIDNMSTSTSVYTPIVEAIVNSIDSIDKAKIQDGKICVEFFRDNQEVMRFDSDALSDISSITIKDNGEGFTDDNTASFDMLYSEQKKDIGGKGFGRFTFLRYFESVKVESVFSEGDCKYKRTFDFIANDEQNIVSNDKKITVDLSYDKITSINLNQLKRGKLDKKLNTIARKILEKILIFFIKESYICPQIELKCDNESIILNSLLSNDYAEIQEVDHQSFRLTNGDQEKEFDLKIFKIYYPDNQKSKICLTAHNREVTETLTHTYIPEFVDNFYEKSDEGTTKDYLIKTYVSGDFLDSNVSLERNSFSFPKNQPDINFGISQKDIEYKAAELTKNSESIKNLINSRQEKKLDKITSYVESNAPWFKQFIADIDIESIPFSLNDEVIDLELNKVKYRQEQNVKIKAKKILDGVEFDDDLDKKVQEIVDEVSKVKLTELAHYVALRKTIIDLFKKSLEIKDDGKYQLEDTVHSIIFPTKCNSENTPYFDHNLWLIDERLNFSEYISSDQQHIEESRDRSDIVVFNKKIAFRTDNTASNPITIFEFKRPQRDDFVNDPKDDPVLQVLKYVKQLKEGKLKTPKGRDILIDDNTPFYGYVVADLTKKVRDWLRDMKEFKVMPDGKGWYRWFDNNNLYMEFISWDRVWQDAELRNKVFFYKLGIE